MHARRNFDGDDALLELSSGAAAVGTVIAHDRSAATAVGAGRDHPEHSAEALLCDATLSAALHADGGRCSGLSAGALARFAVVLTFELDRLFGAGGDFVQGELDLGF